MRNIIFFGRFSVSYIDVLINLINQLIIDHNNYLPRTMFTKQYSISAKNTKIVHTDMNASTARNKEKFIN